MPPRRSSIRAGRCRDVLLFTAAALLSGGALGALNTSSGQHNKESREGLDNNVVRAKLGRSLAIARWKGLQNASPADGIYAVGGNDAPPTGTGYGGDTMDFAAEVPGTDKLKAESHLGFLQGAAGDAATAAQSAHVSNDGHERQLQETCGATESFSLESGSLPVDGCFLSTSETFSNAGGANFEAWSVTGNLNSGQVMVVGLADDGTGGGPFDFLWYIAFFPSSGEITTYCLSAEAAVNVHPSAATWLCDLDQSGSFVEVADDELFAECGCTAGGGFPGAGIITPSPTAATSEKTPGPTIADLTIPPTLATPTTEPSLSTPAPVTPEATPSPTIAAANATPTTEPSPSPALIAPDGATPSPTAYITPAPATPTIEPPPPTQAPVAATPKPTMLETMRPTPGGVATSTCLGDEIIGIENVSQGVCCHVECGACGGVGCSAYAVEKGLTKYDCCISGIMEVGDECSATGTAPCILDPDAMVTDNVEDDDDNDAGSTVDDDDDTTVDDDDDTIVDDDDDTTIDDDDDTTVDDDDGTTVDDDDGTTVDDDDDTTVDGDDGEESGEEGPCSVSALSDAAVEQLTLYNKSVFSDANCVGEAPIPAHCNYMGLGQECRGCFLTCDGVARYLVDFSDEVAIFGEDILINFCPGTAEVDELDECP